MLDFEGKIFSTVSTALRAAFSGIFVSGEYVDAPPSFPAVTLTESSNTVIRNRRTAQRIENGVNVMYEANVYSNKKNGKKAQAREIMATLDEQMASLGFTRTFLNPVPNVADASIYRIVARYEAAVLPEGENKFRIYTN